MKDKEIIEEMAREIEKAKQHIWASVRTQAEDEDYLWHSRAIAEHLMLQGYRKLPKDSVVLSKKKYQKKLDENYSTGYYFGKKETAEKFYNSVKEKIEQIEKFYFDNGKIGYNGLTVRELKELAKSLGAEIKE